MSTPIVHFRLAALDNFTSGRRNTKIDTLVLHTTEARRSAAQLVAKAPPAAVLWFANPKAQASAHYVIGLDGTVWGCVAEGDTAWHAGNASVNRRSLGIEVEGFADDPSTWSSEVLGSLAKLSAELVFRHGIPVLRQPGPGICGHCDVPDPANPNLRGGHSHHHDPGRGFPWEALFAGLRAELASLISAIPPAAGTPPR